MKKILIVLPLAMSLVASAQSVPAQTVQFWHTFGDAKRGDWIQARADDYNKAHPGIKVRVGN